MPNDIHEELLIETIDILREKGIRVIRLDKREIPDAFAIIGDRIVSIEVETDGSPKYSRNSQFDEVISICPPRDTDHGRIEAYLCAVRLRKEGKTLQQIKDYIEGLGVHVGLSTLHDWFRGKSLPRGLYFSP